jgi:hypothetical protein
MWLIYITSNYLFFEKYIQFISLYNLPMSRYVYSTLYSIYWAGGPFQISEILAI